jgi:hypothetical protein
MLVTHLKELEHAGIVIRESKPGAAGGRYLLTAAGTVCGDLIWANRPNPAVGACDVTDQT